MQFIKFLTKTKPNSNKLGNKASNLIKLIKAGIRVPNGFVVNTKSYNKFLNKTKLKKKIQSFFSNGYDTHDVLNISTKIKTLILEAEFPKKVRSRVEKAYNKIISKNGINPKFAVRSSSTFEDLKDFSFAGQAESYLNRISLEDILLSIKNCWASLFSPQALLYLLQLRKKDYKISPLDLEIAIIIQHMIEAQVSGVLFTANVINKDRNQILINSTWGLGNTITSGIVTPDSYILSKKEFEILKHEIGEKSKISVPDDNASSTVLIETNPELKKESSLTDTQLKQLFDLANIVEKLFNYPQDIEWAFDKGILYTLQSRPITTIK